MELVEMVQTIMFHCERALEYLGMRDNMFTASTATFGQVLATVALVVRLGDETTISDGLDQRWSLEKWYKR